MEWSIAGVPLPDLPFLYGPDYAEMHKTSNEIMRSFVESQPSQPPTQQPGGTPATGKDNRSRAQQAWEGD